MDAVPMIDQRQPHVVFIPFSGLSHIKCMLKLARLLHRKGLHITFILPESDYKRLIKSSGTHWLDGPPSFQFKTVPDGLPSDTDVFIELMFYLKANLCDFLLELIPGLEVPVTCIICDGLMTFYDTIVAADKLKIPMFLFWPMAACDFMGFYQTKVLKEKGLIPLEDESYLTNGYLDMEIDWIPGMVGIRLKELPEITRFVGPNNPELQTFLDTAEAADKVGHMIIHTFEELEASLVKELKSTFPSVYCVGPLELLLNKTTENETKKLNFNGYSFWKEEPECVQWLQSKEPNSVVYVNFGSITVMSLQDLVEFGWGLVNSNSEFLWIIRTNIVDGKPVSFPPELEEAMNRKGFVASWCSQEEVLNHRSIGGFLTHGGWGSIIESLSAGVPMLCWPVSMDQLTNCRQMCKEWKVGMEINKSVKREEVEKLVKELMGGEEGKQLRKKALEWKKIAENATTSNGSCSLDIEKLVNEIVKLSGN